MHSGLSDTPMTGVFALNWISFIRLLIRQGTSGAVSCAPGIGDATHASSAQEAHKFRFSKITRHIFLLVTATKTLSSLIGYQHAKFIVEIFCGEADTLWDEWASISFPISFPLSQTHAVWACCSGNGCMTHGSVSIDGSTPVLILWFPPAALQRTCICRYQWPRRRRLCCNCALTSVDHAAHEETLVCRKMV